MHESPDYFKLKVSIFNDDKKTDLIGETWVDLKNLIIPGGGQSDSWHPLQNRGKYSGEVRIEMTYYDTRPEDEAVIERRSQAADKIQGKSSGSTSSSSHSGLRQPKDIKRRPLPSDPNGSRPPPPGKIHSAPAPSHLPSVRREQQQQLQQQQQQQQQANDRNDFGRQNSRHSIISPAAAPPDAPYDVPDTRPMRGYDNPDDFQRELHYAQKPAPPIQHPIPVHPPVAYPQAPPSRFYPAEPQYPYREPVEAYDNRSHYARPHSGHENAPPMDYRSSRQEVQPHPEFVRNSYAYETPPRKNSTRDYPFSSTEQYMHTGEPVSYGSVPKHPQRSPRAMPEQTVPEYVYAQPAPNPELDRHSYRPHSNSFASSHSSLRHSISRDDPHIEYAAMQPRVEDEEEEGPPPPPPVHRSGLGQSSQQLVPSPRASFRAYSPEYASSPRASDDVNPSSQPSHYIPDNVRLQDLPPHTNGSSMPPSLVAGLDPIIANDETDRMYYERAESRRRSVLFEEDGMVPQSAMSQPELSPTPADPVPPADDRGSMSSSLVRSRGGSAHSDSRVVPRRKSVSPHPAASVDTEERPAPRIPFSPDSYDDLNPNASRSSLTTDSARPYDTPAQAMDAARRNENEANREPTPIIGDDGREIDPSDHLPTDTWAPEPEKKNRKPELIVRFKNPPVQTSPTSSRSSRESRPVRVTFKPQTTDRNSPDRNWGRPSSSYVPRTPGPGPLERTPPRTEMDRGRDVYTHWGRGRNYSRSPAMDSPHSSRRLSVSPRPSISPSPGSRSPSSFYAPVNPGPPIPAKVPVSQPMNQSYPVMTNNYSIGSSLNPSGMEALSRELNTIDIGAVDHSRALRKYVPRSITTGYAS